MKCKVAMTAAGVGSSRTKHIQYIPWYQVPGIKYPWCVNFVDIFYRIEPRALYYNKCNEQTYCTPSWSNTYKLKMSRSYSLVCMDP